MRRIHRASALVLALWSVLALAPRPASAAADLPIARRELWLDAATAQAIAGNLAVADSLLVGLLSEKPADPTVLNALGNVRLLQERPGAARVFYEEALRRNPAAGGVRFNLASALLALGLDAAAESVATAALIDVGGLEEARHLMGLRATPAVEDSTGRARAGKKPLDRRSLDALLVRAAKRVPPAAADTTRGRASGSVRIVSKPGASRASGETEARPALYWGP